MTVPPTTAFDASLTTAALVQTLLGGIAKENEEPVHDALKDIDANDWNQIVYAVAECVKRLRHGNIVPVCWELENVPGTATTAMVQPGSATAEEGQMLFKDATLVAIVLRLNDTWTAGTLTVQPKHGGTNTDLSLAISSAVSAARAYQVVADAGADDLYDASALEDIAVDIITSGFTPTTADAQVWLFYNVGEEEAI